MQSLGKVPSARRPPANLPSLKAETQSPADQSGSWAAGAEGGPADATAAAAGATQPGKAAVAETATDAEQQQLKPSGATLIAQAATGAGSHQQSES